MMLLTLSCCLQLLRRFMNPSDSFSPVVEASPQPRIYDPLLNNYNHRNNKASVVYSIRFAHLRAHHRYDPLAGTL
jgi:hypothetical protein